MLIDVASMILAKITGGQAEPYNSFIKANRNKVQTRIDAVQTDNEPSWLALEKFKRTTN